jgi:glutamyl-tRNA synthetase
MTTNVRVRFAPSPTGLLHIGNARTALFNYIFAKRHQGTLILRIEDTDLERSTDTSIDRILEDLQWLRIRWDEGLDRNGPDGPYRQSQRLSLYRDYAEQLLREGKAYHCFCSNERLEDLRKEQISKGTMPRYDGRCRSLSKEEISKMESAGLRPVLRFRVGKGSIVFEDIIHGKMKFESEGIGDFIIVRSDGMAAYNFACVIDDHLMHITLQYTSANPDLSSLGVAAPRLCSPPSHPRPGSISIEQTSWRNSRLPISRGGFSSGGPPKLPCAFRLDLSLQRGSPSLGKDRGRIFNPFHF